MTIDEFTEILKAVIPYCLYIVTETNKFDEYTRCAANSLIGFCASLKHRNQESTLEHIKINVEVFQAIFELLLELENLDENIKRDFFINLKELLPIVDKPETTLTIGYTQTKTSDADFVTKNKKSKHRPKSNSINNGKVVNPSKFASWDSKESETLEMSILEESPLSSECMNKIVGKEQILFFKNPFNVSIVPNDCSDTNLLEDDLDPVKISNRPSENCYKLKNDCLK